MKPIIVDRPNKNSCYEQLIIHLPRKPLYFRPRVALRRFDVPSFAITLNLVKSFCLGLADAGNTVLLSYHDNEYIDIHHLADYTFLHNDAYHLGVIVARNRWVQCQTAIASLPTDKRSYYLSWYASGILNQCI